MFGAHNLETMADIRGAITTQSIHSKKLEMHQDRFLIGFMLSEQFYKYAA